MSVASFFYNQPPKTWVNWILSRVGFDTRDPKGMLYPPDGAFLRSKEYEQLMMKYVPCDQEYGCHEATTYTRSYAFRHRDCFARLGAWRWRGLYETRDVILPILEQATGTIADLGGAGCPLGLNSIVVDVLARDRCGREVRYHSLKDLPSPVSVVFACHVLEHVAELESTLEDVRDVLAPGGHFIVYVPSFHNEGWRAGTHQNSTFGSHVWTFGLSAQSKPNNLTNYMDIDVLLSRFLCVEQAVQVGDDTIFCLGRKS